MSDERTVELVYDGACPVCSFYSRNVDLDEKEGPLERVDARDAGELLDIVTAEGFDLDEGMAVRVDGELYHGAEAMHELAKRSSGKGFVNRLLTAMFKSRRRAEFFYPALKACRNLLLKLLGRSRIDNLGRSDKERF